MKIWNIYTKNLFFAILVVFILIFFLKWWLNNYTRHGQAVVVPEVKGLTIQQAAVFFEKNNLRFEIIDSVYNKSSVPGTIVETIPVTGTKVKENRNIFVTINAFSSQTGIIPDVTDQSQRQAFAKLDAAGFKNVQLKYVSDAYKDLVLGLEYNGIELSPETRFPLNSKLILLVGDGTKDADEFDEDTFNAESPEISIDEF